MHVPGTADAWQSSSISAEHGPIETAVCCTSAWYRNPLPKVKAFLDEHHRGHYKLYNLCCERSYDGALFNAQVEHFGFEDHQVSKLWGSAVGSATLLSCLTLGSHLFEEGLGQPPAGTGMLQWFPLMTFSSEGRGRTQRARA